MSRPVVGTRLIWNQTPQFACHFRNMRQKKRSEPQAPPVYSLVPWRVSGYSYACQVNPIVPEQW